MGAEDVLRQRITSVLRSRPCQQIAFKFENLLVYSMKYIYVAGAIADGTIKVKISAPSQAGRDAEYNKENSRPNPNTLVFPTGNPSDRTIVHEATHAVIDATTVGQRVSNLSDEAAAYLAETVYALNRGESVNQTGPLAGPLYELAMQVRKHTSAGGAAYLLDPQAVQKLKTALKLAYRDVTTVMDGIGDGPKPAPMVPDP